MAVAGQCLTGPARVTEAATGANSTAGHGIADARAFVQFDTAGVALTLVLNYRWYG